MARKGLLVLRVLGLLTFVGGMAIAGCSLGNMPSFLSSCTLSNLAPLVPAAPSGPSTGDAGMAYSFSAVTTDPEGDTINYEFDWGDGSVFGSSGFLASGAPATVVHTYAADSTYGVRARGVDIKGAASAWSSAHNIVIGEGGGNGTDEGATLWQYTVSGLAAAPLEYTHPAIAPDGTIYVTAMGTTGTWTSRLIALRPDGTEKWRVDSNCGWIGQPQLGSDGTIYTALCGKMLTAFSPTGAKKWEFDAGHALGGVAVDDDDNLYCFHYESGAYLRTVASLTETGAGRWVVYLISSNSAYYNPTALVVGTGGKVFVTATSSGNSDKLFALSAATGAKLWEVDLGSSVNAGSMAVGDDGTVYLPLGTSGGRMTAVSSAGAILWDKTLAAAPGATTIGDDGTVYSVLGGVGLTAFSPANGAMLWSSGDSPAAHGNAIASNGVIYYGGSYIGPSWAPLIATNDDGSIRWRAVVPCGSGSPAIAGDGTVIVAGGTTVTAVRGSAGLASSDWPRALNGNGNTAGAGED